MKYFVTAGETTYECAVELCGGETFVSLNGTRYRVERVPLPDGSGASLLVNGLSFEFAVQEEGEELELMGAAGTFRLRVEDERTRAARSKTGDAAGRSGPRTIRSVMPGIVREVLVAAGDPVVSGQPLAILEAMKMQNEIRADRAGTITAVHVQAGVTVDKGTPLLELE